MRLARTKYKLWQIMLAIAALAVLFAGFGVVGAIGMLIAISAVLLPIFRSRPGYRLSVAAWVCSLYPLFVLGSIYTTQFISWCVLGLGTRMALEDTKYLSPIVDVMSVSTIVFLMGVPLALSLGAFLVLEHSVWGFLSEELHPLRKVARPVIPILVWLSGFTFLWWLHD